jgi:hypothetical protein
VGGGAGDCWVWCGADVMDGVVTHLALNSNVGMSEGAVVEVAMAAGLEIARPRWSSLNMQRVLGGPR